ncbi:zinc finger MYM-type protein 6-like [Chiloscyllium plagiosum]|uniref:zinc finger MYM-type protein 6-like n=1 Tax=Chiloscyllium plagiosum TaxID=36176 RepID=UPI001CB7C7E9|nr:zinc finger MYM-type protein 6-like [Chiloscyllium plagiosum]
MGATNVDGRVASYNIAKLIAKCGKPHSVGELLVLPAIAEVLSTVLHQEPSMTIKRIPLSNDSVRRRIDEMASNVEDKLCSLLISKEVALQIDEITICENQALLLGYVRFIDKNEIREELLFALNLLTDTKGKTIRDCIKDYFDKKSVPLKNIVAYATDGTRAMTG